MSDFEAKMHQIHWIIVNFSTGPLVVQVCRHASNGSLTQLLTVLQWC